MNLQELKQKYKHKSWLNDRVVIFNADCLDFMQDMEEDSVDLVFTDPPYKFEAHGRGIAKSRGKTFGNVMKDIGCDTNTNIYTDNYKLLIEKISKNINYIHFCNKSQIIDLIVWAREKDYCFDIIPICKKNPTPFANNPWLMDREWGFHIHKKFKPFSEYHYRKGWFLTNNSYSAKINHPTPKPLYVVESILHNIAKQKEIVFDCFLGSGTTALACIKYGCKFLGIEINQKYFDLSCNRIDEELKQIDMFWR